LNGWKETPLNGIALLISFYAILVLSLFGTIMLIALAKNIGPKVSRILLGLSAIALGCFGVYELWSVLISVLQ